MRQEDSILPLNSLFESVDFFATYYQKQFLQFSEKIVRLDCLFDERDLQAAIQFMPEGSDSLKLVFNGMGLSMKTLKEDGIIPFDKLMRQHQGGATLIFTMLSHHSNRIYHFNKYLESIFNGYVHTNFYGTPLNSRGFKPHSDSHDVLVLQLKGSKDWAFYTAKSKSTKISKAYSFEEIELNSESRMELGNFLYVPRGLIHAAKSTEEVSWHLTIGITGFYWSDLLKEMVEQNVSNYDSLRTVIPKNESEGAIKEQLDYIVKNTDFELSIEEGREKFNKQFPNLGKYLDEIEIPNLSLLQELDSNMKFRAKKDKLSVSYHSNFIELNLPYREKPLKVHHRIKEAINQVETASEFTAKDLGGLSNKEEQLLLTYYLWNNGMIEPIIK